MAADPDGTSDAEPTDPLARGNVPSAPPFSNGRPARADAQASGGSTKQELHKVYAQDRVRALAPEFIVRQTNRLWLTFHPEVARNDRLPDVTSSAEGKSVTKRRAAVARRVRRAGVAIKGCKAPSYGFVVVVVGDLSQSQQSHDALRPAPTSNRSEALWR